MTLAEQLGGFDAQLIKKSIFSCLDSMISEGVRELDKQYPLTDDPHIFITQFEAKGDTPPRCHPKLLQEFLQYRCLKIELTTLINRKAALNYIFALKNESEALDPEHKANLESIFHAIKTAAENGLSIEDSIDNLARVTLQIVGTPHPTDPLSQAARELLTELAIIMDKMSPTEDEIKQVLFKLMSVDIIPHASRSVREEVNQNIAMTLDKLYDNLPYLVNEIFEAYKKAYGETTFLQYESSIFDAIKGGERINELLLQPLLRDASWPGLDADGNTNVTADAMRDSISLYRIHVAEKHIQTLKILSETAKKIEKDLRQALNHSFSQLSRLASKIEGEELSAILCVLINAQETAAHYLSERRFPELEPYCDALLAHLEWILPEGSIKTELLTLLNEDIILQLNTLIQLTQFSGLYRSAKEEMSLSFSLNEVNLAHLENIALVEHEGAIQNFQQLFADYREKIRVNGDAIYITRDDNSRVPASQFVLEHYQQLSKNYTPFLQSLRHNRVICADDVASLNQQFRYFDLYLSCYGLTYGEGHVRQDSSVFGKVWSLIFAELKIKYRTVHPHLFTLFENRSYLDLEENERISLHKILQDGSEASQLILKAIYHLYRNNKYTSKHRDAPLVKSELKRIQLAIDHADFIKKIIISNSQSAANILEVESLMAVFPEQQHQVIPSIVPLLETPDDLNKFEVILLDYIKTKMIQCLEEAFDNRLNDVVVYFGQRESIKSNIESLDRQSLKDLLAEHVSLTFHLKNITIEIMVGFSDTERLWGLPALIVIQEVQEKFIELTNDLGVNFLLYHGPGGDLNRGGLKRRDREATLQGRARDLLMTNQSARWYRETQFYRAFMLECTPAKRIELSSIPAEMRIHLDEFVKKGSHWYQFLRDTEYGLGQLFELWLGKTEHWAVVALNCSSRATQRGVVENLGDRTAPVQSEGERPNTYVNIENLRAISAMLMQEMLAENLSMLGACAGMRKIGLEATLWLYDNSETFRDLFVKESIAAKLRDLSFVAYTLFADYPELNPFNQEEEVRKYWAEECRNEFPQQLKAQEKKIQEMNAQPESAYELLAMLSKLFAYIQQESIQTELFLRKINQFIHPVPGKAAGRLLSQYPLCQSQLDELRELADPLFYMLARHSHAVANGIALDQLLHGVNDEGLTPDARLSGFGRLFGAYGAGIMAARTLQPSYYENIWLNIQKNTPPRLGFERAKAEAKAIGKHVPILRDGHAKIGFFAVDEYQIGLDDALKKKPSAAAPVSSAL